MAIKLGTLLVQTGLITLNELDEALKYQTIFGGKLGTNLIEMGLVEEEDIARLLSRKLNVPYAGSEQLLDIPAGTIKLIPAEIAVKYKVVPFHQEKMRLHLVMMDPGDLRAVDEIGFVTGLSIRPMVAPEISLVLALEKHYGIERDKRYIPVIKQVLKRKEQKAGSPPAPLRPPLKESAGERPGSWRESVARYSIDQLSAALADVKERNEVAARVLDFVDQRFEHAAFFLVRDQRVSGWQARIKGKDVSGFETFCLDLDQPSALKTVVETRSFYLGTPPDSPTDRRVYRALHQRLPETALLIPIVKQARVICVLYVAGGAATINDAFFELQKVLQKASLALDILILRNKILMT